MKKHNFQIKTFEAGAIGTYHAWECSECGASGGAVGGIFGKEKGPWMCKLIMPKVEAIDLPEDCDLAKKVIFMELFSEYLQK